MALVSPNKPNHSLLWKINLIPLCWRTYLQQLWLCRPTMSALIVSATAFIENLYLWDAGEKTALLGSGLFSIRCSERTEQSSQWIHRANKPFVCRRSCCRSPTCNSMTLLHVVSPAICIRLWVEWVACGYKDMYHQRRSRTVRVVFLISAHILPLWAILQISEYDCFMSMLVF